MRTTESNERDRSRESGGDRSEEEKERERGRRGGNELTA